MSNQLDSPRERCFSWASLGQQAPLSRGEPTRSLAQWVTRRAALKKFGAGLAGIMLACFGLVRAAEATPDTAPTTPSSTIPWSQLGAKAGADYRGDGLAVVPTPKGARLRCVFQQLEGEATPVGLWLSSTATNMLKDRFRIAATKVGRQSTVGDEVTSLVSNPGTELERAKVRFGVHASACPAPRTGTLKGGHQTWGFDSLHVGYYKELASTGIVSIDGTTVRFTRPGLIEEYTVSMDGVRQDFVVLESPGGASAIASGEGLRNEDRLASSLAPPAAAPLCVELAVTGARVEPAAGGAQLVLENSGRKIAYSRLHVTDANEKELPARIEVADRAGSPLPAGGTHGLTVLVDDTDAVYPIRIDPTFSDANWISMGGIPGTDSGVSVAVVDDSGNLYIGGSFTMVGDVMASCIAKWNGSSWSALGSGVGGSGGRYLFVGALAVSGSDLYVGGSFSTAGGIAASSIAKWNGSTWSALGSGITGGNPNTEVHALAVSGSDLYAGGFFTTAGGSPANGIAKWNGSSWSALGSGVEGEYPEVSALAMSGSDLYAGGKFTTAGGIAATNIAKWNGSAWSGLGSGMGGGYQHSPIVNALAVSGSDLYAGGYFDTAGGVPATNIAKWNGTSWSALGSGIDYYVNALALSGSDLYAAGSFTMAGGIAVTNIAKWNGSSWSALGSGVDGYNGGSVGALAVSGSDLFVGGGFTRAAGSPANYIAKWNGSNWSALGSGIGNNEYGLLRVNALAVSGSDLYVGGIFSTVGGNSATNITKWNGTTWSVLGSGMPLGYVYALAASGSDLYAGGDSTTAGGNVVAKWDGSAWSALGSAMDGTVLALAMSGSDLYAAGWFTAAAGVAGTNLVAKWNGSAWSALGSGMGGQYSGVSALAVSGSNVYVGGTFRTAGGVAATNIAKWNGSSWSALGTGVSYGGEGYDGSGVFALAVSGSNLYVGGGFTKAGGIAAKSIAKWNGSSWSALGSGVGVGYPEVYALAVSGSNLYAGGWFTTAGGIPANYIAKWNGSSWSALGSGMNSYVHALAVSGSDLYAGGDFKTAGGKVSAYVARAIVNPPVLAIEPDGFGGYFINFNGVPGSAYRVQRAPTLNGPWISSSPQTAPASGLLGFWDLFPPPGQAFYRAVEP